MLAPKESDMPSFRPSLRAVVASFGVGSVPLMLGAEGVSLLPVIVSGVVAVVTYLITIGMRVRAAKKKARAKYLRELAAAQLADTNPDNDSNARELTLAALEDEAEADALNDISSSHRTLPRL
jgi:hypothetical protein